LWRKEKKGRRKCILKQEGAKRARKRKREPSILQEEKTLLADARGRKTGVKGPVEGGERGRKEEKKKGGKRGQDSVPEIVSGKPKTKGGKA